MAVKRCGVKPGVVSGGSVSILSTTRPFTVVFRTFR